MILNTKYYTRENIVHEFIKLSYKTFVSDDAELLVYMQSRQALAIGRKKITFSADER